MAELTPVEKHQEAVEKEIKRWGLAYRYVVEFKASKPEGLNYVVVFSKPVKTKPIPDPILRVYFTVHVNEPLANGEPPMSYIIENQRLRHWAGDGASPCNHMFDVIAIQKLQTRVNLKSLRSQKPSQRAMLAMVDDNVKAHRKIMDNLRRDTAFNNVEMDAVVKVFDEVAIPDPVGTGKVLDRNGLITGLSMLQNHGLAQVNWAESALVDSFFGTFDSNSSGTIDLKEFMIGISLLTKGSLEDKVKLAFHCIDVNKSGHLDRVELGDFLRCLIQAGPAVAGSSLVTNQQLESMVTQAFAVMDVNKDEKISFPEFHKWALGQGHLISAAFS